MRSGIPSGDVDASFPSRERTQEHLPPSERISDIEDSNQQRRHHGNDVDNERSSSLCCDMASREAAHLIKKNDDGWMNILYNESL